jgi:hypothetical protein
LTASGLEAAEAMPANKMAAKLRLMGLLIPSSFPCRKLHFKLTLIEML